MPLVPGWLVTELVPKTLCLSLIHISRLLRAAVPLPTISAVLGHASQESTNVYLSTDEARLLE